MLHTPTENCSDESDPVEAGSGLLFSVSELVGSDILKDKAVYFRLLRPSEDTCWTHRVIPAAAVASNVYIALSSSFRVIFYLVTF